MKIDSGFFLIGLMQIVTLYGTRNAVASGKSLYRVEMSVGSLSYARDLLRVAWENPLVSCPILDPCHEEPKPDPHTSQRVGLKV